MFDSKALSSLSRPHFSPSAAKSNDIDSCQARWAAERLLPDDDDPLTPAPLGTAVHLVAELLFRSLPTKQHDKIIDIAIDAVLAKHCGTKLPLPSPSQADQWRIEVATRSAGLRTIDYAPIEVLGTEQKVTGSIDGIPFLGYIDLLARFADGSVCIIDLKSGKPERPQRPATNGSSRREFWLPQHDFQIQLYAIAVIQSGLTPAPTRGAVLYSRTGQMVEVDLSPSALSGALNRWHRAHGRLERFMSTGAAATRPSPWCARCPIRDSCPVKYTKSRSHQQ